MFYTIKYLQKHPNCKVVAPPEEVKKLPRKGYQEWDCSDSSLKNSREEMEKKYEKSLNKVLHCVKERRFSLRPYFQDFDKTKIGHVTRGQLRQVLAIAAIPLTQEEVLSLEFMHNNDIGFHYFDFVNKLDQLLNESPGDKKQSGIKLSPFKQPVKHHAPEEKDIDLVLAKIKAKVVCNGIKVNEFLRKLDKRNAKVLKKLDFERGLDQLKCDLTYTEVKTLLHHFAAPNRPDYIDYWKFSEVAEGAITEGHLEKSPTSSPVRHVPSGDTPRSFLNFDERQILMRTLNVLSAYIDNNLEDLFQDFDKKMNTGTVTKNQLIRVLSVRKIISVINANELDILFKCFSVGHVTTEQMFHYRSFLNALRVLRANKTVL